MRATLSTNKFNTYHASSKFTQHYSVGAFADNNNNNNNISSADNKETGNTEGDDSGNNINNSFFYDRNKYTNDDGVEMPLDVPGM